ncbi:hypothetical protein SAMD00019534_086810 [Acytostelium subglobosum LB1]|uniref:hypothetical protein n=1 Tax=Acytostelium subglobosum LB1 TaxID=1410327 RepID=UPI000644A0F4|nr:hypothetical protein SAMD00019534_086810 [Acytostelium subglobosum LB1]GAM25506.1 hypothetical protein SAMD00019534_086810 [Acytostelium subglobosum LB1]|eukprot:XP_012751492.1 hypothetical protein SAMD00019534_086810 [Acytostelium subglobosum LB1]
MNKEQLQHLESIFNECDTNGSGFIDKNQLRMLVSKITTTGLEEDELDALMKALDSDNDGKVALQEFIKGYDMIHPELLINDSNNIDDSGAPVDEEKIEALLNSSTADAAQQPSPEDYENYIRSIFNSFDKDGDGAVNKEQLREMLIDIKAKSGIEEGEDEDIDYIVDLLSESGKRNSISFSQFMSTIEHMNNSPADDDESDDNTLPSATGQHQQHHHRNNSVESLLLSNSMPNLHSGHGDDQHHHHNDENNSSFEEIVDQPDLSSFSTFSSSSSRRRSLRSARSSWYAPVSIVQMIKKRTDLFNHKEIEEFTNVVEDPEVVDKLKEKEAHLKSVNLHLGTKINMVEGQLREVKESHDKLSEDNAQLKKSVVIGKKTLIQNQKLASHNKLLEESIEMLKKQLQDSIDAKNELSHLYRRLRSDRESLSAKLDVSSNNLSTTQDRVATLETQLAARATASQSVPLSELEHLKVEMDMLKERLEKEVSKANEEVKLLSDEGHLLKKQNKDQKQLLDSSNQIIHKLRSTIEEIQSKNHNSDSSYKLSLLSELEQQVVNRLGTPGLEDSTHTNGQAFTPQNTPSQSAYTPQNTPTQGISIDLNGNGRSRMLGGRGKDDNDTHSNNDWKAKYDELSKQLVQVELQNFQLKQINETFSLSVESLEQTNQTVDQLQSRIKELTQQTTRLEEENSSLKSTQQNSINLPQPIDPVHIKAEQTQGELSLLKQRIEELAQKNTSLLDENTALKRESGSFSPVTSSHEIASPDLPSLNPASENNAAFDSIVQLQGQVNSLTSVKDQLEKDLLRYKEKLERSDKEARQALASVANDSVVDELRRENESLKANGQKLDERSRVLDIGSEQELNNQQEEIKQLRADLEDVNSKLQNQTNLNRYLQSQLDSHDQSINQDQTPLLPKENAAKQSRQCCGIC